MSYRGRCARRREHKALLLEARVQAEVKKRPPRVEVVRVPAIPPITSTMRNPVTGETMAYFELTKKPDHRVIEIPVAPTGIELEMFRDHIRRNEPIAHIRTVKMQAREWGMSVDNTRVRWWSWEPMQDVWPAQKWHAIHRALAYAGRAKQAIRDIMGVESSSGSRDFFFDRAHLYGWSMQQLVDWLHIVVEDLEQIAGEP